ncbi:MAG: class I SAM-dependent methyltransferase [Candidatus Uhrbacteria bacterium]
MDSDRSWERRIRTYLAEENIGPLSFDEVKRRIPAHILNGTENDDPDDPFGCRLMTYEEIRDANDALASYYDILAGATYHLDVTTYAHLAEYIDARRPAHIVDGGCGTGAPLAFLAAEFPDLQFTGYDISPEMVKRAVERALRRGLQNVRCFTANHENAPQRIAPGSIDLLFERCAFDGGSFPVFEFFHPPPQWSPLAHIMRDVETFYKENPTMQRWRAVLGAFASLIRDNGRLIDIGRNCAGGVTMFTELARRAGLERDEAWCRTFPDGDEPCPSTVSPSAIEAHGETFGAGGAPFVCALALQRQPRACKLALQEQSRAA